MVFKLQHPYRSGISALVLGLLFFAPLGHADNLDTAKKLYRSGKFFLAARTAFSALESDKVPEAEVYSWVTASLVRARLFNSASYFFIRTLQSGDRAAIKRVLGDTETLVFHLGVDLFRKYLVHYAREDDFDSDNRSALAYALGKDALLAGDEKKALGFFSTIARRSAIWPYALQVKGTALAILGQSDKAVEDFSECIDKSEASIDALPDESDVTDNRDQRAIYSKLWTEKNRRALEDLKARCQAGKARTLYQDGKFEEAEIAYDAISKVSFVWTDILFEQAWNAFAQQQYNRTLGKLVTYKSPSLEFVFNSEVEVLRAQSFLNLCLYADANDVINQFNDAYTEVGKKIKNMLQDGEHDSDFSSFHQFGKDALRSPLHTRNVLYRVANRFVRSPTYQTIVSNENSILQEAKAIDFFDTLEAGHKGLPGFLKQVLGWRKKTIQILGGTFVRNSLIDYYNVLISDFEKMAFIKLEMLKRAKDKLMLPEGAASSTRGRGDVIPRRRDDQFYWSFNGEFWNDEIGDYVFGLQSEC